MALPKNKKLPDKTNRPPLGGRPVVDKDDKNKPNKPKGPKVGKFYGGIGGYKGVRTKKVRRLVNGVIREEMNDLRAQGRQVKQDANNENRKARRDYRRGGQDLTYVHGETQDYLNNLAQRNQQMYQDQSQQSALSAQALGSMLGNTYSGAQSQGMEELARLGITGGGNFSGLQADQANAQSLAAIGGQNTQDTMGLQNSNAQLAMQSLQGMNQGSYMQGVGQNLNARNDKQQEILTNRVNQMNQVRHAMKDAKGERRDLFFQMLQQLQQTGWDQYLQAQQLKDSRKH
jgi:hypothetical protein